MAGELPLQTQEAFVVTGLDEFVNDGGGGGEAGFDAMLAGRQADAYGDMGFANTAGTKGDDVLAAINELRAGQIQDQFLVERGDRIEVEALQAFDGREPGRLDAPIDHARLAIDQFQFDQPRQITDMINILGRAVPGQLLLFPEHGWQSQLLQMMLEQ